jgi:hypothetical protein
MLLQHLQYLGVREIELLPRLLRLICSFSSTGDNYHGTYNRYRPGSAKEEVTAEAPGANEISRPDGIYFR